MAQDITVPDLGDFKDVEVIDVLVKAGDKIEVDTPLITLETEKATIDVPSTSAGTLKSLAIKKGDRVSKGSVIGQLEGAASVAGADGGSQIADSKEKETQAPPPAAAPSKQVTAPSPQAAAPAAPKRERPVA